MVIKRQYSSQAFEDAFYAIINGGREVNGTKVIYNVFMEIKSSEIIHQITYPKWRKFNAEYAALEFNWYMSGDRSIKEISKRAKLWKKMADEDGNVWSNYGYHWGKNNQLEKVIQMLEDDKNTRRAIVSHYDYNELDNYKKDTPCNVYFQFQYVSDNILEMTINARSIDLIYGFCNDIYCFSRIFQYVANRLDADMGSIFYNIANLHVYEKHWKMHER